MTNNDELAIKLKAAAEKYNVPGMNITDYLDAEVEYFSHSIPANILALLAERDADKKRIAELELAIDSNETDRAEFADELGCAGDNESVLEAIEELKERARTAELSVSILEARTVSVKLPENIPCPGAPQTIWLQTNGDDSNESSWPENSNDVSWCWEKMFHNDTLYVRADLAAGIKLEVGE